MPIIIRIQKDCTPEVADALDNLHKEMKKQTLKRPPRGGEARHDEVETTIIQALAPLQNTQNFGEVISKTNDYKQTLAHFAILFGYTNLLSQLVGWNIDLTIADVNGFTALHCAYKIGDRASVNLLLEKGASETVMDALGRAPSHLMPEGFASWGDHDTNMASDGQLEVERKCVQPSLSKSTDSRDRVSDSGDEESMNKDISADSMHHSQLSDAASNQTVHNSFDNTRFQPGAQQRVVGPSGSISPPKEEELFYAPQIPPFNQPNSDVGHPTHPTAHPTAHSQPAFNMGGMSSTLPITAKDGRLQASPYTISPVSDGSFAQQQQSYPAVLERPSTSDSIYPYHIDVPPDEYGLCGHGVVVPSASHPFDRPFIHMPPDVSNRNFLPHQPPEGAVHVTPRVIYSPSIFPALASVTNGGSDIASFIRCVQILTRLRFAATLRLNPIFSSCFN